MMGTRLVKETFGKAGVSTVRSAEGRCQDMRGGRNAVASKHWSRLVNFGQNQPAQSRVQIPTVGLDSPLII